MSRSQSKKKKQYRHEAKCIFCDNPANSKEHLWPKWAAPLFLPEISDNAHTKHTVTIQGSKKSEARVGHLSRAGNPLAQKLKIICTDCNNGWMSRIEEKMKPIFIKIFISGRTIVSFEEQTTISKWCRMKLCLHQKIYQIADFSYDLDISQAEKNLSNQWDTFRRTGNHGFSIFIARTDVLDANNLGSHNYTTAIVLDSKTNSVVDVIYTGYFSLGPMTIFFSNSEENAYSNSVANNLVTCNPSFLKVSSSKLRNATLSQDTVTFGWLDLVLEQDQVSNSSHNSIRSHKFRRIREHAPKGKRNYGR